jgi:hypothetical protein
MHPHPAVLRQTGVVQAMDDLYFRTRENGAMVFRIDTENRQRRLEMIQIAVVNIRSGEVKPHNDAIITAHERTEIEKWLIARRKQLNAREVEDVERLIDQMNWATQWAQARATADQIETYGNPLLMAMHDLRSTIVRKKVRQNEDKG